MIKRIQCKGLKNTSEIISFSDDNDLRKSASLAVKLTQ